MELDVFAPIDQLARAHHRAEYRRFSLEHNGRFNTRTGAFERIEAKIRGFLAETSAATDAEAIAGAEFAALYRKFEPRDSISAPLLLLLAIVKLQAPPRPAHWFDEFVSRARSDIDELGFLMLAGETAIGRILRSASRVFGINPPGERSVGRLSHVILSGVPRGPRFATAPVRYARALLDAVSLLELLRVSADILRGKPHLLEPLEKRLLEALVQQVGLVSFSRIALDRADLAYAAALLPPLTLALFEERREMSAIGAFTLFPGTYAIRYRLKYLLPKAVRDRAYIA